MIVFLFQKVIDMVHQVNFTKRKTRDMLQYKMNLKSDKLVELKVFNLLDNTISFGF